MEYVVVGAGALGQSFTALLAGAGERVTLFSTSPNSRSTEDS
jgi:ketopantoate reductase